MAALELSAITDCNPHGLQRKRGQSEKGRAREGAGEQTRIAHKEYAMAPELIPPLLESQR